MNPGDRRLAAAGHRPNAALRDYVGDYQRQLFLIDHAGLPLKTVLEQLDLLGEEVVPVLRKEFQVGRSHNVPDAPTHALMVAAERRQQPVIPESKEENP